MGDIARIASHVYLQGKMMYPIMVPCFGYDDHLAANIAISLTGMGVDMGSNIDRDMGSTGFFDDVRLNELNAKYLDRKLTLNRFVDEVIEHFTERSEPWGAKISVGLRLLPVYRHFLPEMSLIVGLTPRKQMDQTVFNKFLEHNRVAKQPTMVDYWEERAADQTAMDILSQDVPAMVVPSSFFYDQREKALIKIAEFIGGYQNRSDLGRMVDSAMRKLYYVYSVEENKSASTEDLADGQGQ